MGAVLILPVLTTSRLRLEPVTPSLLPVLVVLNSAPEVMRYLLGRSATPEETAAEWEVRSDRAATRSVGWAIGRGTSSDEFVGWWSASHYAADPALVGIGYRLLRSVWGRGLATEGARAMVGHAFSVPEVERVIARTMAVNAGSRRVMERPG